MRRVGLECEVVLEVARRCGPYLVVCLSLCSGEREREISEDNTRRMLGLSKEEISETRLNAWVCLQWLLGYLKHVKTTFDVQDSKTSFSSHLTHIGSHKVQCGLQLSSC